MKKKIVLAFLAIIILVSGFMAWKIFGSSVHAPKEKFLYIRTGENMGALQQQLLSKKILSSTSWFRRVSGWLNFSNPKPGRYEIKDGSSVFRLVKLLRSGIQTPEKVIVIKERTKELFAGKIERKYDLECDSIKMITFLSSNDSLKDFGVDTNTVMTIVMPYTYNVNWNSSARKLFEKFYEAYEKFWTSDRIKKADSLGLTPAQVSILASIVEEETTRKADKFNIASTYLNRLRTGMKLQADPTVKFVTRNFQLGRIQGIHLRLVSPYNTYLNTGLPPGPICTPSIESLEAVLHAPATGYLFFVASHTFDGSTIFTTNYDDHLKYVRLFHDEQNRRADSLKKLKAN